MEFNDIKTGPKVGNGGPLVLLFDPKHGIYVGRWCHGSWMTVPGDYGRKSTHWMPLPAFPVT